MKFLTDLLFHQKNAVEKLKKIKVGALFMEQGTGKTRTMLELIDIRYQKGRIEHVIWLCPCSVKENLRRDIIKHCGRYDDKFITICGIETLSTSAKWINCLNEMSEKMKCYLIVDESSKVKNFQALRTQHIVRIAENCTYKCILNGTPVTRNEVDLFAQMYILDWRILGYKSMWSFAANHIEYDEYGKMRRCLNVGYLTDKIAPYAYQILKSECLDLPSKTHGMQYFMLSEEQEEHYEEIKNVFLSNVDEFDETTIYRLLTALQLVIGGYRITPNYDIDNKQKKLSGFTKKDFFDVPMDNPRMQCLKDLVDDISEKCIIFCKYSDEITTICNILGDKAVRFDGSVSIKNRQKNIDLFKTEKQFLVANKTCAGFGLNLQFCSYIIFYSNDFDYGTRAQAEDRVHRIGQDKNVHIIDICAINKLDERIIDSLNNKENLAKTIAAEIREKKDKKEAINEILVNRDRYGYKHRRTMRALDKSDLLEGENNDSCRIEQKKQAKGGV